MPLIVFDLDGTLIDSSPGIQSALDEAIQLIAPDLPGCNFRSLIGPPIAKILERAYPLLDESLRCRIAVEYRRIYDGGKCCIATLYDGVRETLIDLASNGYTLAIFTNKPRLATDAVLTKLGLNHLFAKVMTIDSQPGPFPSKVAMLTELLCQTTFKPTDTLVVGDSPDDGHAADHCRAPFIAVTYGFGTAWSDPSTPKSATINHFQQLPATLATL